MVIFTLQLARCIRSGFAGALQELSYDQDMIPLCPAILFETLGILLCSLEEKNPGASQDLKMRKKHKMLMGLKN